MGWKHANWNAIKVRLEIFKVCIQNFSSKVFIEVFEQINSLWKFFDWKMKILGKILRFWVSGKCGAAFGHYDIFSKGHHYQGYGPFIECRNCPKPPPPLTLEQYRGPPLTNRLIIFWGSWRFLIIFSRSWKFLGNWKFFDGPDTGNVVFFLHLKQIRFINNLINILFTKNFIFKTFFAMQETTLRLKFRTQRKV